MNWIIPLVVAFFIAAAAVVVALIAKFASWVSDKVDDATGSLVFATGAWLVTVILSVGAIISLIGLVYPPALS
jgi:putative exporter of polyketide antibiotics